MRKRDASMTFQRATNRHPNVRKHVVEMAIHRVLLLLSHCRVQLLVTLWTTARQASLCFPISWSLLKLKSIESAMPSSRLGLCRSLPLLPSIFPRIRVFSNEPAFHIRWPKCRLGFLSPLTFCDDAPSLSPSLFKVSFSHSYPFM